MNDFISSMAGQIRDRINAGNPESAKDYMREHRGRLPELRNRYIHLLQRMGQGEGIYDPEYLRPGLKKDIQERIAMIDSIEE